MNKAFVREPDEPGDLKCPGCGAIGLPVGPVTLAAHLAGAEAQLLGASACFCPSPTCAVAYFDAHGVSIPADRLLRPAYPKSRSAPVCPCLNVSPEDVERDAEANDPIRVRQILKHAETHAAACTRTNPAGRACTAEVQKLYLRCLKR